MSHSLHRQLIRGIRGLSPARMIELQAFLSRSAQGNERSDAEESADGLGDGPAHGRAADGDLPQPVCAQEEPNVAPQHGWGPPPLVAVQFDVIGCLIREANEARNARRQRFGM